MLEHEIQTMKAFSFADNEKKRRWLCIHVVFSHDVTFTSNVCTSYLHLLNLPCRLHYTRTAPLVEKLENDRQIIALKARLLAAGSARLHSLSADDDNVTVAKARSSTVTVMRCENEAKQSRRPLT
jgi:hypothetical protein